MYAKEKRIINKSILIIIISLILLFIIFYIRNISNKFAYATDEVNEKYSLPKISNAPIVDLDKIIRLNTRDKVNMAEIYEKQEELEYITKYRENCDLYVGTTEIYQEGRNGIQTITMKKTYDNNGEIINEEQVSCVVTKSSIDKIIDIGTKIYVEPEKPKKVIVDTNQSSKKLDFDVALNKPSGFTLEQFKIALSDNKDKNKIFEKNSEYFYYLESEYSINGIFIAAMGIHECSWGTSKLAINKYNLFGYGAYDSNPYNGAYTFSSYSESIDLIARVMAKYYLNPPGKIIYDGQVASRKVL